MKLTESTIQEARELLKSHDHGVLSTLSLRIAGIPFGSVATYCLDLDGAPILLFSTIAEHSKNLQANPSCSITVLEGGGGNVQAKGRLTLSGEIHKVTSEEAVAERYYRYFPESQAYRKFHDFDFFTMRVSSIRYIGGFGKIHWIAPGQLLMANPFSEAEEKMICDHMNEQHHDSLIAYFALLKDMKLSGKEDMRMCGIDAEGFDIRLDGNLYRFKTDEPMRDAMTARKVLTDLAKQAAAVS